MYGKFIVGYRICKENRKCGDIVINSKDAVMLGRGLGLKRPIFLILALESHCPGCQDGGLFFLPCVRNQLFLDS